jgi:hypothetical protein
MSPEDDFRQLASSNPLFRFGKMTFRRHLITGDDLLGPGQFRLTTSRNSLFSILFDIVFRTWDHLFGSRTKSLKNRQSSVSKRFSISNPRKHINRTILPGYTFTIPYRCCCLVYGSMYGQYLYIYLHGIIRIFIMQMGRILPPSN